MSDELSWLSAQQLRERFQARSLSPVEYAIHVLDRIERVDARLHAFITVDRAEVLAQARRAEQALFSETELGPLHGVPVSIKDSIPTRGLRTTYGSLLHTALVPSRDAVVVERLRRAGAIILGKTNVPEFQVVGRTKNRLLAECVNPWDLKRTAAGSSGGSAASIAAGIAPISIGGDDGGSIRLPAAYCGIFGLCPSAGRVPRLSVPQEGAYPGFIFQNIGPMTRCVEDAITTMRIIAGPDASDAYAMPAPPADWLTRIEGDLRGMRAAWVTFAEGNVQPAVEQCVRAAFATLSEMGCELEDPGLKIQTPWEWLGVLNVAYLAPFFDTIRRDPAKRQLITPYVEEFLAAPQPTLAQEKEAWRHRQALVNRMNQLLQHHPILVTPTTGRIAPEIHESWELLVPTMEYAAATIIVNATGLTAASVPCGFVDDMPVGLQVIGARGDEAAVLRVAKALEQRLPWAVRRPLL